MRIIGIDVGLSGAVAVLDGDGRLIVVHDMPVAEMAVGKRRKRRLILPVLAGLIADAAADIAYVERVNAMPGQGVSAMFQFGESYGAVQGIIAACHIRTELISPVVWKKHLGIRSGKDEARMLACRRWPASAGLFARKKDDGRAEACLIAAVGAEKAA